MSADEDADAADGTRKNEAPPPAVGHRRPPLSTRFVKGQSGNPKGRPRGRYREAPFEAVLGQRVTIRDGASERQVTAAEAFLLQLAKRGLEGDGIAARAAMAAIEGAAEQQGSDAAQIDTIILDFVRPGSVNAALEPLRMARKLDPYRPTARMMLESWLVEAALARLGPRRLTRDEQTVVLRATRLPHNVVWPNWWEADLRDR